MPMAYPDYIVQLLALVCGRFGASYVHIPSDFSSWRPKRAILNVSHDILTCMTCHEAP